MVMKRVVVVGDEGALGQPVAQLYRDRGDTVVGLAVEANSSAESLAAAAGDAPIDVLVFADDYLTKAGPVTSVTRLELAQGFDRLAMLPFRTAVKLKPSLVAVGGKVILLSRLSATMETPDTAGLYRDRPFRAAAHALWRCLSVEWRNDGVVAAAVALPDILPGHELSALPEMVDSLVNGDKPKDLLNLQGQTIGW